jgi:hypothetical protein
MVSNCEMKALPKIRLRRILSGGTFLRKRQPSASIASNDPRTLEVNQLAVQRWSYGRERWLRRKLEAATREFYAETWQCWEAVVLNGQPIFRKFGEMRALSVGRCVCPSRGPAYRIRCSRFSVRGHSERPELDWIASVAHFDLPKHEAIGSQFVPNPAQDPGAVFALRLRAEKMHGIRRNLGEWPGDSSPLSNQFNVARELGESTSRQPSPERPLFWRAFLAQIW